VSADTPAKKPAANGLRARNPHPLRGLERAGAPAQPEGYGERGNQLERTDPALRFPERAVWPSDARKALGEAFLPRAPEFLEEPRRSERCGGLSEEFARDRLKQGFDFAQGILHLILGVACGLLKLCDGCDGGRERADRGRDGAKGLRHDRLHGSGSRRLGRSGLPTLPLSLFGHPLVLECLDLGQPLRGGGDKAVDRLPLGRYGSSEVCQLVEPVLSRRLEDL
jgi:hypothetical protein